MSTTSQSGLVTLESHMRSLATDATGAGLSQVMLAISVSARAIAETLRNARLRDVLGEVGNENVQGEEQQKLDVIANDILKEVLATHAGVMVIGSEEDDELIVNAASGDGPQFGVMFDPLDGSSNLDVAGGVGTIFSVYSLTPATAEQLQPGRAQIAAGYVLYGSSTLMVMTTGNGVQMFVLDTGLGAFVRVEDDLRIPARGKIYSVNEANFESFPDGYQAYLRDCHEQGQSARYAGAMVADVHRVLLKGGVFMYPPTGKAPNGKLRLMYECNPMTMVVVQAGGLGETGSGSVLDVEPGELHQRVPIVIGSPDNVNDLLGRL
ncbi:MAG: class 1 fructose-bisphosphatase [Pseudomonadota bacterium]